MAHNITISAKSCSPCGSNRFSSMPSNSSNNSIRRSIPTYSLMMRSVSSYFLDLIVLCIFLVISFSLIESVPPLASPREFLCVYPDVQEGLIVFLPFLAYSKVPGVFYAESNA
jgi:hypothetical protein